jgi:hypothetical protein
MRCAALSRSLASFSREARLISNVVIGTLAQADDTVPASVKDIAQLFLEQIDLLKSMI